MSKSYPSLVAAVKTEIGMLSGQNSADFLKEFRALTPADREWFVTEFAKVGVTVEKKEG